MSSKALLWQPPPIRGYVPKKYSTSPFPGNFNARNGLGPAPTIAAAGQSYERRGPRRSSPPPPSRVPNGTGSQRTQQDDIDMWLDRLRNAPPTARGAALEQLLRIDAEGAFTGLVGGSPSPASGAAPAKAPIETSRALDPRGRRLVTEIVAGVTRWQRRLAWQLSHLPKPTALQSMDPPLRLLLYMGAYELYDLRMAPHAINDYVELARLVSHDGCAKVANGVLRNVARTIEWDKVPQPPAPKHGAPLGEIAEALAVSESHPTWLVRKWVEAFGEVDTERFLKCNNTRPVYSVRLVTGEDPDAVIQDLAEDGIVAHRSKFLPNEFLVVEEGLQRWLASGVLQKGQGQVQDEAAGMVVALLDPREGESVLDTCSAPGGKSLFAAARMRGRGRLVAADASASRLKAVSNTAKSQGMGDFVECFPGDARQLCRNFAAGGEVFDKVLVDAPCSGTGVLAKRADLRWRRRPEDIAKLCGMQAALITAAADAVRPGGLLVYSTCSIEAEENEGVVHAFLEQHPEFSIEVPGSECHIPSECLSPMGALCMLPHIHGTDGAFAVRLRKAA